VGADGFLVEDLAAFLDIARLIATRDLGLNDRDIRIGELRRHYFSLLFTIDSADHRRFVVKIPKADLRTRPGKGILPLRDEDRALGRAEFDSLQMMTREWHAEDLRIRWVHPVTYVPEWNAVVTERAAADEAYPTFLALARRALWGGSEAQRTLESTLARFGGALRRFHDVDAAAAQVSGADLAVRLRDYRERLRRAGAAAAVAPLSDAVLSRIAARRWPAIETRTFKGIDIRNFLLGPDGWIWLVDPGKSKRAPAEADLSRFLFTWRILFWGTPWFALNVTPQPSIETAFIHAYDRGRMRDRALLDVFLLKELLKHWIAAHDSLAKKGWSGVGQVVTRVLYIDRFFHHQVIRLAERCA
jgi:hypothetical protein